jgi:NAD(P)-dependent dehydrogenase (short-subunit alcohol dehydrogenase family)
VTGRTAVVTGAAGGLGAATVRRLAAGGWRVYAADLPSAALDELASSSVVPVAVDVTDSASLRSLAARVAQDVSAVDALVTFAGVVGIGPLVEIDDADFRRVLDVNVVGTFLAVKHLFPLLHAARGRIVLLSSETGWQTAMPFNGPYAMSKHAVEAYADSLRRELALLGVTVVKIRPGAFRTGMVAGLMDNFERLADSSEHYERVLRAARKRIPQEERRAGDPDDLAALIERVVTASRPRSAYRINTNPQAAALSALPTGVLDRLLHAALKRA